MPTLRCIRCGHAEVARGRRTRAVVAQLVAAFNAHRCTRVPMVKAS